MSPQETKIEEVTVDLIVKDTELGSENSKAESEVIDEIIPTDNKKTGKQGNILLKKLNTWGYPISSKKPYAISQL
jgi:hypothetical protein